MRLSINRMVHVLFYATCLFIIIAVCTMPITISEKAIHSFAWVYMVLMYAYFFDEQPPKFLRIENLYGTASEEYHREYLDELVIVSQHSLALMRKIQLHEDFKVVNQSIDELKQRKRQLKRLSPPRNYVERHQEILHDIDGFLEGLADGDYYVAHSRTR